MSMAGYYKVHLEDEGFKMPVVVFALSGEHAIRKALDDVSDEIPNARSSEVEGPYLSLLALN